MLADQRLAPPGQEHALHPAVALVGAARDEAGLLQPVDQLPERDLAEIEFVGERDLRHAVRARQERQHPPLRTRDAERLQRLVDDVPAQPRHVVHEKAEPSPSSGLAPWSTPGRVPAEIAPTARSITYLRIPTLAKNGGVRKRLRDQFTGAPAWRFRPICRDAEPLFLPLPDAVGGRSRRRDAAEPDRSAASAARKATSAAADRFRSAFLAKGRNKLNRTTGRT